MFETESKQSNLIYFKDDHTGYWTIGHLQDDGSYAGELGGMIRDTVPWCSYYNGLRSVICNVINQYIKECEENGVEPEAPVEWEGF